MRIEINKPLKRCLRVDFMGDGMESLMILRYERLHIHCFRCGMVDHKMVDCLSNEPIPVINGVEQPHFRIWMRASPCLIPTSIKEKESLGLHKEKGETVQEMMTRSPLIPNKVRQPERKGAVWPGKLSIIH